MKKTLLIVVALFFNNLIFSQNKNLSIGVGYGINKMKTNNAYGGTINLQVNYRFYSQKRANFTLGLLLNSYKTPTYVSEIVLRPNGTPYIKETSTSSTSAAFGIAISSQIKLFSLDKKLVLFFQPQLIYLREKVDKNLPTFGQMTGADPTHSGINAFNGKILLGISYNHRFQFGIFYSSLLSNRQSSSILPDYTFGGKLSYLFNITFKKKEEVKE